MALISGVQQKIHIKLYYREKKMPAGFTKFIIVPDEEAEKILEKGEEKLEDKTLSPIQCLNTYWKVLDWASQNKITEQSSFFNEVTQSPDINVWKYRDLRIRTCLIDWDLKDDQNVAVSVNDVAISMLPGDIVLSLIFKYDESVTLTAEDRKK